MGKTRTYISSESALFISWQENLFRLHSSPVHIESSRIVSSIIELMRLLP